MCGLTDHVTLSEQEVTKKILLKLGNIDGRCLLHGLPTMSDPPFSWCPPRFVDIPTGGFSDPIKVLGDGTLVALWEIWCISKIHVEKELIQPLSADLCVQSQVHRALQKPEECVILTYALFYPQGLLVRLKVGRYDMKGEHLYCKYIGGVNVSPSGIRKYRKPAYRHLFIGYQPWMVDVGAVDWEDEILQEPASSIRFFAGNVSTTYSGRVYAPI